ncbi:MAG: hypothetical protein M1821_007555 [Bathelium mastoideum]|nr:MAG: hypothetical protein M1821_007555 [Bathelium mastoideum]KAI9675451.1 MAG: hypothetical protein M1822_008929 [Bathelium mastoideum]
MSEAAATNGNIPHTNGTATLGAVTKLLTQINENTSNYLKFLTSKGLPEPSFEAGDGLDPRESPPGDIIAIRDAAIEAADELHHLLLGPLGLLLSSPGDQYLLLSLQYIYRYKIAYQIPTKGSITFASLAEACNLPLSDLRRFMRVAIGRHVFSEPVPESIAHTASSLMLLHNPMMEAWILNIAEEFWPALSRTVDATQKWPGSEEPNESGYSLGHNTNENPFDIIKKDDRRQQQFIDAMSYSHLHSSYNMKHLLDNYDFGAIGKDGVLVDVGGSHAQVSIAIAQRWPEVKCIVQDLPDTIKGLDERVPAELKDRVSGMEHDFLTEQPVKGADVYLLRWILHDWSDKYSIKILQGLVPALKKGAKVVINDICIPPPGMLGVYADRNLRLMDISMKAFNNARERDPETWAMLFAKADPRFKFMGVTMPPEARMVIIVAEWTGE